MLSLEHRLPASATENELLEVVRLLNADPQVDGILVQLPLHAHIDEAAVIAAIDPAKDVDGFHVVTAGTLADGDRSGLVPCTPLGCLMLLKETRGDLSGLGAVVDRQSVASGQSLSVREDLGGRRTLKK